MLILFLALTAATVVAPILIRTLGRPAFGLLALVPGIGFFWVLSEFIKGTFKDGGELLLHYAWMPSAHLNIDFRMDSLAALFSLIVLGVGALVLLYCWGYFDSNAGRLSAFGAELVAFAMAMFGLVISDNILLMYVFWEITSVLSFLLVGYYGERASSRRSAGQALMVTTLGGLAMLVGIILMGTKLECGDSLRSLPTQAPGQTFHISLPLLPSFWLAHYPNQLSHQPTSGFPARWPHQRRCLLTYTLQRW